MRIPLVEDLTASFAAFREIRLCVATFCGIILFTATSLAQTAISERIRAGKFISALRVDQAPRIDGLLDDTCWQKAEPITNFAQVLPVEGAAASERTEVRFAYTRDVLFIAIRCFDREPRKILAKTMQRDNTFDSDDYVKIAFDTFGRQRDGYVFMVNPAGARSDSIFGKFSSENRDFDALWDARARIVSDGWVAEIAIPFKSISFDAQHDFWRMNIERVIRHKQETVRWTAISRAKSVTALEDFGDLRELRELRQGLGLEFRPYVVGRYRRDPLGAAAGLERTQGSTSPIALRRHSPWWARCTRTRRRRKWTSGSFRFRDFRLSSPRSATSFCRTGRSFPSAASPTTTVRTSRGALD